MERKKTDVLVANIGKYRQNNMSEISQYLFEGKPELAGAPSDIKAYYFVILEEIKKLPPSIKQTLWTYLRNIYLDRKERR